MTFFIKNIILPCTCQKKVVPLRPILFCGIVRIRVRVYMIVTFLCCWITARAEDSIPVGVQSTDRFTDRIQTDSVGTDSVSSEGLVVRGDSLMTDSVMTDSLMTDSTFMKPKEPKVKNSNSLKAPVHYQAKDSMIMTGNGTAYLHGKGVMTYESMELNSEYIRMNIDSSQIYARGVFDTINEEWVGRPIFKDGKDEYETNEITSRAKDTSSRTGRRNCRETR